MRRFGENTFDLTLQGMGRYFANLEPCALYPRFLPSPWYDGNGVFSSPRDAHLFDFLFFFFPFALWIVFHPNYLFGACCTIEGRDGSAFMLAIG